MKLLKKIAAVALAMCTGASVFAFSACDSDKPFGGLFPPSGDGNTDNENGNNELPDDEKGDSEAFFASLAAQPDSAAAFETEIGYSTTKSIYTGSSPTNKIVVSSTTDDIFTRGKADFVGGDLDLAALDSKTEVAGSASASDNFVSYFFRRDGHEFVSRERGTALVDDYSELTFTYGGEAELEGGIAEIFQLIPKFPAETPANFLVARLADTVGALKVGKKSAAIDVNAMLYKIATDFQTVLKGVNADTTAGTLLENATVKKYMSVFTELVPVENVASLISHLKYADMISAGITDDKLEKWGITREQFDKFAAKFKGVDFSKLSEIRPDEKSTTYDYILKLLKSDELKDVLNAALFEGVEDGEKLPRLTEVTLTALMVAAGMDKNEAAEKFAIFKNYADMFVSDSFTKTAFTYTRKIPSKFPAGEDGKGEVPASVYGRDKADGAGVQTESYTLSNAVIKFDLTEDGAAGTEHISFLLLKSRTEAEDGDVTLTEQSLAVDAKVDFSETVELADIGNCTALYTAKSLIGASEKVDINRADLDGGEGIAPVVLRTLTDFGGNFVGVYVCDKDDNQISNGGEFPVKFALPDGGEETLFIGFTFSQYEESGDVKVSLTYGDVVFCSAIIWSSEYTFSGTVSELISKQ